ncbi:carboxymuconolactone decarboxylase family protein [Novosphingobium sp. KCTC 2891]|uniref:carboxymuconolactone decarboxylase family protein n=1 Tax=Novosphingobium sp. KCTC 2891 TaxID=2989730 RepID=UPI0022228248|nr:carboxymuconolactone decarboxylase family protein [Novosphingobium sp. KCTC 2891]MCW1383806.1 carboxymuconolactone decarboxylase family protein [Novosphingobium sp. KCTC 2891]
MKPQTPFTRIGRAALSPAMQASWDRAMDLHGDATFTEVMGNAPDVYAWYSQDFYAKLYASGRLEPSLVEIVRLRFANVHGCAACSRGDRIAAMAAGVSAEQVDAITRWQDGPFSARERGALELADVMVLTNPTGMVTADIYARLKECFSDGELVELGVIMAVLGGMAKFVYAFDLLERMDTCPFTGAKP